MSHKVELCSVQWLNEFTNYPTHTTNSDQRSRYPKGTSAIPKPLLRDPKATSARSQSHFCAIPKGQLHDDKRTTAWWQKDNCMMTKGQLHDDKRTAAWCQRDCDQPWPPAMDKVLLLPPASAVIQSISLPTGKYNGFNTPFENRIIKP